MFDLRDWIASSQLSSVLLWIIFSYMSAILNCDLQRLMKSSTIFVHISIFIAILFLFDMTANKDKNDVNVIDTFIRASILYILLLAITHCKWYFVLPAMILLLIDQLIEREYTSRKMDPTSTKTINIIHNVLIGTTTLVLIVGSLHYSYLQKIEYGDEFSWMKFWFMMPNCKDHFPDYKVMKSQREL